MDTKILALCILIGIVTGLRAMTGIAIIAGAAHFGWIDLSDSPLHFLGSLAAMVLFIVGALAEFVADKLPRTGKRTAPGPLIARMTAGGFCGAAICFASAQLWEIGVVLGALGATFGSFAGYYARIGLVRKLTASDFSVALPEDLLAIGLAILVVACL